MAIKKRSADDDRDVKNVVSDNPCLSWALPAASMSVESRAIALIMVVK